MKAVKAVKSMKLCVSVVALACAQASFANDTKVNMRLGISSEGFVIGGEREMKINEVNYWGFGAAIEGQKQDVYRIELKKELLKNLNKEGKELLDALKDILKRGRNNKEDKTKIDAKIDQLTLTDFLDVLPALIKELKITTNPHKKINLTQVDLWDLFPALKGIEHAHVDIKAYKELIDKIGTMKESDILKPLNNYLKEVYKQKVGDSPKDMSSRLAIKKRSIEKARDNIKKEITTIKTAVSLDDTSGFFAKFNKIRNNISISKEEVQSYNLNGYLFAKQKFGTGPTKFFLREDVGLVRHIGNPFTAFSVKGSFAMGVEFNEKISLDLRAALSYPLMQDRNYNNPATLQQLSIKVPKIWDYGVNLTVKLW